MEYKALVWTLWPMCDLNWLPRSHTGAESAEGNNLMQLLLLVQETKTQKADSASNTLLSWCMSFSQLWPWPWLHSYEDSQVLWWGWEAVIEACVRPPPPSSRPCLGLGLLWGQPHCLSHRPCLWGEAQKEASTPMTLALLASLAHFASLVSS